MKTILGIATAVALLAGFAAQAADRIVLPDSVIPAHYDIAIVPDAAKLAFTGHVAIDIEVKKPGASIVLNAADLVFQHVALEGVAPKWTFDTEQQTATLTFPSAVSAGHHVLTIDYTGKINQHAAGLFALDYDTPAGRRRALFTQFENSDARRFVPCWDEPARKATFTLTATVPAGGMAISNMPVANAQKAPDGRNVVRFAASPKMSSYLLFFGLGDFERVSRRVNNVDVGVVFKRGDAAKAQFALDAAAHILPYYERYFAYQYPLPKLDLIAGPGESQFFGAMENWGAIFYFERDLLIDPKLSTQDDRRNVYLVVAHEMAHQWFGDLVTMDWWDGIWLNEGFASWMELKATDNFHPEWKVWLEELSAKEGAMQIDARAGTHPIITPIRDVLQANQAFDTITYSKGAAVIRMLENYAGADAFRAGVRAYIKAHAYANTVSDDLWRELDKTSASPVTPVAHAFTLQAGVPLITASADAKGVRLTQSRFTADDSGKAPTAWPVPVTVAGGAVWHGLVSRGMPVSIALSGTPIVNAGQAGYFRTLYAPALFPQIAAAFAGLAPEDQLGLLNDSRALAYSNYEPFGDFLSLAQSATPDFHPLVLATLAGRLQGIDTLYESLPGQTAFRAFARHVLSPIFARVGWSAKPGESQNVTLLRGELLSALGEFDDAAVVGEAHRRFEAYVQNPSSLDADLRDSVLEIIAEDADAKDWDQLHALAKAAKSSLEKQDLFVRLGYVHDPALARRALQLALGDEAPLTVRPAIVRAVSVHFSGLAVDFAIAHADVLAVSLEPDSRAQFVPRLASNANDPAMIATLRAYAAAHIPASAQGDVVKAAAAISYKAEIRKNRLPDIDRWLAAHPG